MKKVLCLIGYALLIISLTGCASLKSIMRPSAKATKTAGAAGLPSYSGPKAKIAVADFDVKTPKAGAEIGSDLRKLLVTVLIKSNRFDVVEPQALNATKQEQDKVKTGDLIVTAAVTEFEPQVSGGRAGIGGGGGVASGRLGGLLGVSLNKARMTLEVRIVDASTSETLAVSQVQGQTSDVSSRIMTNASGNLALVGGLSAYVNTPIEKAIRICILEAVRYISKAIPATYYKY